MKERKNQEFFFRIPNFPDGIGTIDSDAKDLFKRILVHILNDIEKEFLEKKI